MLNNGMYLVTGAASGMGASICKMINERGGTAFGIDRLPGEHVRLVADLTDGKSLGASVTGLIESEGRPVRGLINAAGVGFIERFEDATDESWMRVLDVNLMGTVRMCRIVLPHMQSGTGNRSIINFGSQAGKSGGLVVGAHYSASKAAVFCLTKTLAGLYGPEGIRVNAVSPGVHDTPFLDALPMMRGSAERIPLRRLGTADDVAGGVLYLLSDLASYVTGEILDINGGLLMD